MTFVDVLAPSDFWVFLRTAVIKNFAPDDGVRHAELLWGVRLRQVLFFF